MSYASLAIPSVSPARSRARSSKPRQTAALPVKVADASRHAAKSPPARYGGCACGGICPQCAAAHATDGGQAGRDLDAPPHPFVWQRKLRVGAPNDKYEQEADRIAGQVVRIPEPRLHRACACGGEDPRCQDEQPAQILRRLRPKGREGIGRAGPPPVPPFVDDVLRTPGQAMDPATRGFMEPRFGSNFSYVRIHSDAEANQSALRIGALAYAVGNHIVFRAGHYTPHTPEGRRLLAHELTHVLQQEFVRPAGGDVFLPVLRAPPGIQRAISYGGPSVHPDIDLFDPATAVAEDKEAAVGVTRMAVDGVVVAWNDMEPAALLDLFFPLPAYSKSGTDCMSSGGAINYVVTDEIHVLKNPPWSATVAHADLATIYDGRLASRAGCTGGEARVVFTGKPTDEEFHKWLIEAEKEHAADNACLVNKYLVGYERDVNGLPAVFSAGYWRFGDCNSRLEERLQRPERFKAMIKEMEAMRLSHDWPTSPGRRAGPHKPRSTVTSDPKCTEIKVTLYREEMSPWPGSCEPWSPPEPR